MLTRNPGRTLSATCIKIQQKLLHKENKTFQAQQTSAAFCNIILDLAKQP